MSPERTASYRRVLQTLADLGPSKLQPLEQERIRFAVDTLIFSDGSASDEPARDAVADTERLCRALVESGRWELVTAERLATTSVPAGPASCSSSKPPPERAVARERRSCRCASAPHRSPADATDIRMVCGPRSKQQRAGVGAGVPRCSYP